jgi:hypothetical protein
MEGKSGWKRLRRPSVASTREAQAGKRRGYFFIEALALLDPLPPVDLSVTVTGVAEPFRKASIMAFFVANVLPASGPRSQI